MYPEEGYFSSSSIRLARESRGRSQSELAKALNVSQGKVSKWEEGIAPIAADDVKRIGEFLDYPSTFFVRENRIDELSTSCLFHRRQKSLPLKELRRIHACVNITRGRVERLLRSVDEFPIKYKRLDIDDYGSPEEIANVVRNVWNVPRGPIKNLVALIEAAGGVVIMTDFGTPKVDAISQMPPDSAPLFFVNKRLSTDRMRFTLAHEVGHLFMHAWPSPNAEEEADAFASEFLMPELEARPEVKNLTLAKAASLKPRWGISIACIVRKAATLNEITPAKYRSLNVQMSQNGIRKVEPYPLPPERPTTLDRLVQLHRRHLGYSKEEFATLVTSLPERLTAEFHSVE